MAVMAKNYPKADRAKAKESQAAEDEPTDQILVRLPDPRLAPVLTELARSRRRSRNLEIVSILEREAQAAGLWPPKP